jgi:phage tail sheath gpL-like
MLKRPSITLDIVGAITLVGNSNHRVLLIGEIGNSSTTVTNVIQKDIQSDNIAQFGDESQLYLAIQKFKEINDISKLDILPIAKGTTKATATITIANNATKDGKLKISIGGKFVEASVKNGDTKVVVATTIESAFSTSKLYTVTRASNVVTLTTKQPTASINGTSIVITESATTGTKPTSTSFVGGVSTTLDDDFLSSVTIDERYQSIVFDYENGTGACRKYLENNFNLTNNINDGVAFSTVNKSLAGFKTLLGTENYKTLVLFGNLNEMKYDVYPLVATIEIVAIRAMRLTPKANISKYVLQGSIETEGGMSISTLPYFNTPLTFSKPIGTITESQLVELTSLGGSVWTHNGVTVLSEVTTTYKTNNVGEIDGSWKFLNYIDTMSTIREYIVSNLRVRYGQVRLTDGELISGKCITNTGAIKATVIKLYNDLSKMAITRKGFDKFVSKNITIKEDLSTGYVKLSIKTPIVTQLRGITGNVVEVLNISTTI